MSKYGEDRLRSVVFASAVPPFLMKGDDNPEGPLPKEKADMMTADLRSDRDAFFDQFTTQFFSANGVLGYRSAAADRTRYVSSVGREGRLGMYEVVRNHRFPRRSADGHRTDTGHSRRC